MKVEVTDNPGSLSTPTTGELLGHELIGTLSVTSPLVGAPPLLWMVGIKAQCRLAD